MKKQPILGLAVISFAALLCGQQDCSSDYDGDGYSPAQGDCNDDNADVYPEAPETCNLADEDCDSVFDEGYAAGCGIIERQFPNGEYLYQSLFTQSFPDQPYVTSYFGYVNSSSSNGTYAGQWSIAVWNSLESYQADASNPDCFLYEHMSNTHHVAGSDATIDYDSCPGCEPFSDFYANYWEDTGCDPAFLDFWFRDPDTGTYDYDWTQPFAYRDAATRGWPAEFSIYVEQLEAQGGIGVIYDFMIQGDNFAPQYYVVPTSGLQSASPLETFKALPVR